MPLTADQVAVNIVNQLRLLDPTTSAAVGTPERKIIEAVAEMIASAQVDFSVLDSQFDLDSMTGGRLDAYLGNFGFGRQQGVAATGTITFTSATPAARTVLIPRGTQVTATLDNSSFPTLIFTTTTTVTLEPGETSVDVPGQCSVPGTIGNIDASQITGFAGAKNVTGITTVSNTEAFTGGTDAEDDAAYKVRFKNTMFRNMNGTYDQFLALAVSSAGVTKANVVGPISRYQEYVLIPAADDAYQKTPTGGYDDSGTAWLHKRTVHLSSIPYSKYAYPTQGDFVTDGDLDPATSIFYKRGVDYVLNAPPIVAQTIPTVLVSHAYQAGDVVKQGTHVFVCVGAGMTDSPVTLTTTTGAVTTETAGAVFKEVGSVPTDTQLAMKSDPTDPRYDVRVASRPNVTFLFDDHTGDPVFPVGVNGDGNDVLLLEHQYISTHSRNDLRLGILNAVDVFINGAKPRSANSIEVIPPTAGHILQHTNASKWTFQDLNAASGIRVVNFRRDLDGRACAEGSLMVPLYWQPALTVPNKLTIGLDVYFRANFRDDNTGKYYNNYDAATNTFINEAHYLMANEVQLGVEGSIRARSGFEWLNPTSLHAKKTGTDSAGENSASTWSGNFISHYVGSQVTIKGYTFDQNVSDLQAIMEKNKAVATDVLVHRARTRYFRLYVAIMYNPGATQSVVNAAINAALDAFLQNTYFGAAIQMSDLLNVIHNVPGVDNVRWAMDLPNPPIVTWNNAANPINFKVQEVYQTGDELEKSTTFSGDFYLSDNELAAASKVNTAVVYKRTANTWGN